MADNARLGVARELATLNIHKPCPSSFLTGTKYFSTSIHICNHNSFAEKSELLDSFFCSKGWLASAKLRSLVEIILARPIRGQDFNFSFNVTFLSTTDINYVGHEVDSRPALQEVDQHV